MRDTPKQRAKRVKVSDVTLAIKGETAKLPSYADIREMLDRDALNEFDLDDLADATCVVTLENGAQGYVLDGGNEHDFVRVAVEPIGAKRKVHLLCASCGESASVDCEPGEVSKWEGSEDKTRAALARWRRVSVVGRGPVRNATTEEVDLVPRDVALSGIKYKRSVRVLQMRMRRAVKTKVTSKRKAKKRGR